jgi:hypothetical protein
VTVAQLVPEVDAEAALIGCLLHMPAGPAAELLARTQSRDVSNPQLNAVLAAVRALVDAGTDPEPTLVLHQLQRTGEVRFLDGHSPGVVLADLMAAAPAVVNAGHYLKIVREQSLRRRTIAAATRLQQAVDRPDLDGLADLARELLDDLAQTAIAPAAAVAPEVVLLPDFLAVADEPQAYRVAGLWPIGGRVLLAAQYKAGKTTLLDNLVRALVDDEPFLGRFDVEPIAGRVVIIDNELDERMLRRWLREQGIAHPERVAVLSLRGRVGTFNLLEPSIRRQWAGKLRAVDASVVLFDCLRPVLDALNLSEDKEAGRFLVAFDALLHEAGVGEAAVVHHMGHQGERSRGDSRLRDWPDVAWQLVREADENGEQQADARRYFAAHGRDVLLPEGLLSYDHDSRRLTLAGGSRKDTRAEAGMPELLEYLEANPGASGRAIEAALKDSIGGQKAVRATLARAVATDAVDGVDGPRRSFLHFLAEPSAPSASPVRPTHSAQSVRQCVSASLEDALHSQPADGTQTTLDGPTHSDPDALDDDPDLS